MANANINPVSVTSTFDEWRVNTNDLIKDRNILRNFNYVKDEANFTVANGEVTISRSTGGVVLTTAGSGGASIGGDLSVGVDATIGDDLTVGDQLTVTGNAILQSNLSVSKNTTISQNLVVTGTANVTNNFKVGADKFIITASSGDTLTEGDLNVNGGDIVSTATANLLNTSATAVNFGRLANTITLGNTTGNVIVQGDLNVVGGDIVSTTTANVLNTVTTTLNIGGEATTVEIGAASGTTNINNNLDVDGDINVDGGDITTSTTTMNVVNATATTVNFAGAATALNLGAASGTTDVKNNLNVTGDLDIDGGDITSTATANLLNTSATTINFGRVASTITIGNTTGSVTVQGDLTVSGGDITSTATANLLNTTTTTLNLGGAATTVEIGAATGTTNINNDLDVDGDVNIDGGDLTVSTSSFNLANTTATTVNFAGSATALNMGAAAGTTTIAGDLAVSGGDITSTATANVANTSATAVNLGGAATTVRVGSTSGTTVARNDLTVTNDLTVSGGDITSTAVANLLNTVSTTINFGGSATTIEIGSASGTTDINNNLNVTGDLEIDGGDLTVSTTTMNLVNATATTVNFAGAATALNLGAASGTTDVKNNLNVTGDLDVDGGDITSTATANIVNVTSTTVNFAGAATTLNMGASSGTTDIKNNLNVTGDLDVDGGDITSTATANIANTSATAVNLGGAAATVRLGSTSGTTVARNDLSVTANGTVSGTLGVTGNTNISSNVNITQNAYVTGTTNAAGELTASNIKLSTSTTRWIRNGDANFGDVTINGTLTTTAPAISSSDRTTLRVGVAAGDGHFSVNRAAAATGNATLRWFESGGKWQASANDVNAGLWYDLLTTQGEQTISGNLVVSKDVTISGNLRVEGDSTTFNVASLAVEDNEIILNSNQTGIPSLNASITAERGSSTDTFVRWNENTDKWGWSDDGSIFYSFDTALSAFAAANTSGNTTSVSANTGSTQRNVGLNFSNTANVAVAVTSGTSGNANIAFDLRSTGVSSGVFSVGVSGVGDSGAGLSGAGASTGFTITALYNASSFILNTNF